MNIGAGQTVAFVGPSGGGKSTLASLIARFFDIKDGSIKIGGSDIRNIPKEKTYGKRFVCVSGLEAY